MLSNTPPQHSVPHLTTALTGPLLELESHLLDRQTSIEAWFRHQWLETRPPLYASVDLRNAGFKLAPVDANLFPAGFNNLNPEFLPLCIQAVQAAVEHICPTAVRILLVPEDHTRNRFYLESLATLRDILIKAGYETRIGSLLPKADLPMELVLESGQTLTLEAARREGDRLLLDDFDPCLILLNNDLSAGPPETLTGLEQVVSPPLGMGWTRRRKTSHFTEYSQVAQEFSALVDIDPWLIDPLFRNCGQLDFKQREGEECLSRNVEALIKAIGEKYRQLGLERDPFVIIKADAGTYGMAVMTAHSAADVQQLNRKQRNKMSSAKGGGGVSQVIIQEGVYTFETWGEPAAPAEPVVYLIDRFVVGGFYRVHTERGPNENLNAPGMHFQPLAFDESCITPDRSQAPDAGPNRFYAYGVVARLALVAAARELAAESRQP